MKRHSLWRRSTVSTSFEFEHCCNCGVPAWHCACGDEDYEPVEMDAVVTFNDWGEQEEEAVHFRGYETIDFEDLPDHLADRLRVECAELWADHENAAAENEWERWKDDIRVLG